jgi:hypothetical protein
MFGASGDLFEIDLHTGKEHQIQEPYFCDQVKILVLSNPSDIGKNGAQNDLYRRDGEPQELCHKGASPNEQ